VFRIFITLLKFSFDSPSYNNGSETKWETPAEGVPLQVTTAVHACSRNLGATAKFQKPEEWHKRVPYWGAPGLSCLRSASLTRLVTNTTVVIWNGKRHPRTGHEGPEGEYMYSSTLSLTSALDRVGGRHARFIPGKTPVPIV